MFIPGHEVILWLTGPFSAPRYAVSVILSEYTMYEPLHVQVLSRTYLLVQTGVERQMSSWFELKPMKLKF